MAVTLEEAKKNVQDDLQMGVIDEFQKSNWILETSRLMMQCPRLEEVQHPATVIPG